jgi:hypothetical protein
MGCSVSAASAGSGATSARLALAALVLGGCASALPGEVAHEGRALDLEACLRADGACVKTGAVASSEALFAGAHAVSLTGPAEIRLPLLRVLGGERLRWLAFGLYAYDPTTGRTGGKFTVQVDGQPPIAAEPNIGFVRVEVDMNDLRPAPGAQVTLRAEQGRFDFVYAVGRWDE